LLAAADEASRYSSARSRCYKAYLGKHEREGDDFASFMLSQYLGTALGDLALSGELAEFSARAMVSRKYCA
jgi:hypothetical protein